MKLRKYNVVSVTPFASVGVCMADVREDMFDITNVFIVGEPINRITKLEI